MLLVVLMVAKEILGLKYSFQLNGFGGVSVKNSIQVYTSSTIRDCEKYCLRNRYCNWFTMDRAGNCEVLKFVEPIPNEHVYMDVVKIFAMKGARLEYLYEIPNCIQVYYDGIAFCVIRQEEHSIQTRYSKVMLRQNRNRLESRVSNNILQSRVSNNNLQGRLSNKRRLDKGSDWISFRMNSDKSTKCVGTAFTLWDAQQYRMKDTLIDMVNAIQPERVWAFMDRGVDFVMETQNVKRFGKRFSGRNSGVAYWRYSFENSRGRVIKVESSVLQYDSLLMDARREEYSKQKLMNGFSASMERKDRYLPLMPEVENTAGHLVAIMFKGPQGMPNLVLQAKTANEGCFLSAERALFIMISNGCAGRMTVDVEYPSSMKEAVQMRKNSQPYLDEILPEDASQEVCAYYYRPVSTKFTIHLDTASRGMCRHIVHGLPMRNHQRSFLYPNELMSRTVYHWLTNNRKMKKRHVDGIATNERNLCINADIDMESTLYLTDTFENVFLVDTNFCTTIDEHENLTFIPCASIISGSHRQKATWHSIPFKNHLLLSTSSKCISAIDFKTLAPCSKSSARIIYQNSIENITEWHNTKQDDDLLFHPKLNHFIVSAKICNFKNTKCLFRDDQHNIVSVSPEKATTFTTTYLPAL